MGQLASPVGKTGVRGKAHLDMQCGSASATQSKEELGESEQQQPELKLELVYDDYLMMPPPPMCGLGGEPETTS